MNNTTTMTLTDTDDNAIAPVVRFIAQHSHITPDDIIDKIQTFYRNDEFLGPEKPYTPIELIREISALIPVQQDSEILIFYTIEWAHYFIFERGVSPDKIMLTTATFDVKISKLCEIYGCRYAVIGPRDEREFGMKFDVIVGNPPFQSEKRTGTQPLWPLFVKKAHELLSETGHLAMITPNKWCGHTTNVIKGKIRLYKDIFKGRLVSANIQECSKYFPKIGGYENCFSYFVINNAGASKFEVTTIDGKFTVPATMFEYLPFTALTALTSSILAKIKTTENYRFKQVSTGFTNQNNGAVVVSMAQRLHYDKLNVYYDRETSISATSKSTVSGKTFANSSQEKVDAVFRSKLFKFLHKIFWNNDNFGTSFYNSLPYLDLNILWTDNEIYNHFNLSPEEIQYIEQVVN